MHTVDNFRNLDPSKPKEYCHFHIQVARRTLLPTPVFFKFYGIFILLRPSCSQHRTFDTWTPQNLWNIDAFTSRVPTVHHFRHLDLSTLSKLLTSFHPSCRNATPHCAPIQVPNIYSKCCANHKRTCQLGRSVGFSGGREIGEKHKGGNGGRKLTKNIRQRGEGGRKAARCGPRWMYTAPFVDVLL